MNVGLGCHNPPSTTSATHFGLVYEFIGADLYHNVQTKDNRDHDNSFVTCIAHGGHTGRPLSAFYEQCAI